MLKIVTAMYISDSFYGTMQVCDQSGYETSVARCSRRWRLVRLLVGRAFGLGHPRGKRFSYVQLPPFSVESTRTVGATTLRDTTLTTNS